MHLTQERLAALFTNCNPPCVSLYLPTHRSHPENQQDPIRYRNLLEEMEDALRRSYPERVSRTMREKFQELAQDDVFWNHRTEGLAVLGSSDSFEWFDVQRAVPEKVVVGEAFHLQPLIRDLQSVDRFQVLCLSRKEAKLFEGNRYVLDPVELTNAPSTIAEALGEELTDPHLTVASYGAGAARSADGGATPSIHGQGGKKDEVDLDRDRFFRAVDRAIYEHHSRPTGLPLMLASLEEHHAPFHSVSRNPFLLSEGISIDPDSLDLDQLREAAWRIVEPRYVERLEKCVEDFHAKSARQLGSDELSQISEAASAGRVETLLVEEDRKLAGNAESGGGAAAEVDEVLDELAEQVLRTKGKIVVIPADLMPSDAGVVAMFRY